MKNQTAWAICSGRILLHWTIRRTRKETILDFVNHANFCAWKNLEIAGYRVVKITISSPNQT
jgi:hypothetical protein